MLVLNLLAGCTSNQLRDSAGLAFMGSSYTDIKKELTKSNEQQVLMLEEKSHNTLIEYYTCVESASEYFSKSDSSASEAATAALSKCSVEKYRSRKTFEDYLSALTNKSVTDRIVQDGANKAALSTEKTIYEKSIGWIVESRMSKQK